MSKGIAHSKKSTRCRASIFFIEGNVKLDELAKDGALMDGGQMAQMRASTVQQATAEIFGTERQCW